jgi:hypothetical protein
LRKGNYALEIFQGVDTNRDGVAEYGSGGVVCEFKVKKPRDVKGCNDLPFTPPFGKKGKLFTATLYVQVGGANHVVFSETMK